MMNKAKSILLFAFAAFLIVLWSCSPQVSSQVQPQSNDSFNFKGRFLVSVSDVDMVPSAYIDNQLGKRTPEMEDTMTIIPLDGTLENLEPENLELEKSKPVTIPVSNSVGAWPNNLALTPDGNYGFVAENFGQAPSGAKLRSEIPPGRLLSVIDLRNLQKPQVVDKLDLGNRPLAVSVHPDGNLIAVSLVESKRQIALIPFNNGKLGKPTFLGHPGIEDPEVHTPHLQWDRSGRFLAANFPSLNQAVFYQVDRTNPNQPTIRQWGNSVVTGKFPAVGYFTPNNRYFIATNLLWGDDVEDRYIGARYGYLTVIRFATDADSDGEVRHEIVSTAPVGGGAENFAISPDGNFVATLNMERTYLPWDDSRLTRNASITLLSMNADTGELTPRDTFSFEGILPQGITFDATGDYLAVTTFDHFEEAKHGSGSIDFWRVVKGDKPRLDKLEKSIPVMRGPHIVMLQS